MSIPPDVQQHKSYASRTQPVPAWKAGIPHKIAEILFHLAPRAYHEEHLSVDSYVRRVERQRGWFELVVRKMEGAELFISIQFNRHRSMDQIRRIVWRFIECFNRWAQGHNWKKRQRAEFTVFIEQNPSGGGMNLHFILRMPPQSRIRLDRWPIRQDRSMPDLADRLSRFVTDPTKGIAPGGSVDVRRITESELYRVASYCLKDQLTEAIILSEEFEDSSSTARHQALGGSAEPGARASHTAVPVMSCGPRHVRGARVMAGITAALGAGRVRGVRVTASQPSHNPEYLGTESSGQGQMDQIRPSRLPLIRSSADRSTAVASGPRIRLTKSTSDAAV